MVEHMRHNSDENVELAPYLQRNLKLMLQSPKTFLTIAMTETGQLPTETALKNEIKK